MNAVFAPVKVSPREAAMVRFREGEGLESNPFPKGSDEYQQFQWEMHKLQDNEFRAEMAELKVRM